MNCPDGIPPVACIKRTRGHTYKLDYPRVSDNMTRRFLMCRIVNYWNSLPIAALECTSTGSFRNCVCRLIPDNVP